MLNHVVMKFYGTTDELADRLDELQAEYIIKQVLILTSNDAYNAKNSYQIICQEKEY